MKATRRLVWLLAVAVLFAGLTLASSGCRSGRGYSGGDSSGSSDRHAGHCH